MSKACGVQLFTVMILTLMILSVMHQDRAMAARSLEETIEKSARSVVTLEASDVPVSAHGGHSPCPGYDPGHCHPPSART